MVREPSHGLPSRTMNPSPFIRFWRPTRSDRRSVNNRFTCAQAVSKSISSKRFFDPTIWLVSWFSPTATSMLELTGILAQKRVR